MWWSFQVQEMRFRLGGLVVLTGWKEDMIPLLIFDFEQGVCVNVWRNCGGDMAEG